MSACGIGHLKRRQDAVRANAAVAGQPLGQRQDRVARIDPGLVRPVVERDHEVVWVPRPGPISWPACNRWFCGLAWRPSARYPRPGNWHCIPFFLCNVFQIIIAPGNPHRADQRDLLANQPCATRSLLVVTQTRCGARDQWQKWHETRRGKRCHACRRSVVGWATRCRRLPTHSVSWLGVVAMNETDTNQEHHLEWCESRLSEQEGLHEAYLALRRWATALQPEKIIPDHLDHGRDHIERVTKNAATILYAVKGNNEFPTPATVFVVLGSALLHDCGIDHFRLLPRESWSQKHLTGQLAPEDREHIRAVHAELGRLAIRGLREPNSPLRWLEQQNVTAWKIIQSDLLLQVAFCAGAHTSSPEDYLDLPHLIRKDKELAHLNERGRNNLLACIAILQCADLTDMDHRRVRSFPEIISIPLTGSVPEYTFKQVLRTFVAWYVKDAGVRFLSLEESPLKIELYTYFRFPASWETVDNNYRRETFVSGYRDRTYPLSGEGLKKVLRDYLSVDLELNCHEEFSASLQEPQEGFWEQLTLQQPLSAPDARKQPPDAQEYAQITPDGVRGGRLIKRICLLSFPDEVPSFRYTVEHLYGKRGYEITDGPRDGSADSDLIVLTNATTMKDMVGQDTAVIDQRWTSTIEVLRAAVGKRKRVLVLSGQGARTLPDNLAVEEKPLSRAVQYIDGILLGNVAAFVASTGLIGYREYHEGSVTPILPSKRCKLYVECGPFGKNNRELLEPVRDLFYKSGRIAPRHAEEYSVASRSNTKEYVKVLVEELDRAATRVQVEPDLRMYFTDYAIANTDKPIWLLDESFRTILARTLAVSYHLGSLERKVERSWITRFFFFPAAPAEELQKPAFNSMLENAARVIFLLLALGVDVRVVPYDYAQEHIPEHDLNLFLVPDQVVGILDTRFPYIRVYRNADSSKQTRPYTRGYLSATQDSIIALRDKSRSVLDVANVVGAIETFVRRPTDEYAASNYYEYFRHVKALTGSPFATGLRALYKVLAYKPGGEVATFANALPFPAELRNIRRAIEKTLAEWV